MSSKNAMAFWLQFFYRILQLKTENIFIVFATFTIFFTSTFSSTFFLWSGSSIFSCNFFELKFQVLSNLKWCAPLVLWPFSTEIGWKTEEKIEKIPSHLWGKSRTENFIINLLWAVRRRVEKMTFLSSNSFSSGKANMKLWTFVMTFTLNEIKVWCYKKSSNRSSIALRQHINRSLRSEQDVTMVGRTYWTSLCAIVLSLLFLKQWNWI